MKQYTKEERKKWVEKNPYVRFNASKNDVEIYKKCAKRLKMPLSQFIRLALETYIANSMQGVVNER